MDRAADPVLLIGGDGFIGAALAGRLRAEGRVVDATSRRAGTGRTFDLADPDLARLDGASAVVICAAMARLKDCERDPAGARAVNVDGPARLAREAAARNLPLLQLSTDKVFDGNHAVRDRDDMTDARTVYGRLKAEAERRILEAHPGAAILRLSKVVSPELPLIEGWRRDLMSGRTIAPFSDMWLAPVLCAGVCSVISRILAGGESGLFHYTGARDVTYEEFAFRLAQVWSVDPAQIQARPMPAELKGPPEQGWHTTLEMSREQALWGVTPPSIETVAAALGRSA